MSRCVRLVWILLLAALASPRVAHAEWLPGDPPPMPEDALWQPMRIPSFEPGGLPLGVADYQGKLVMVGGFGAIGRTRTLGAVAWDGVTFERLGTPKLPRCQSVLNWSGVLVASRGSTSTSVHEELFQWNGADWDTLATANGLVGAIQAHASGLVAFGTFTKIGGVTANHVALFDGSTWHAMGAGIPQWSNSSLGQRMVSVGPDLYVISNGLIQRWDGSVWNSSIGSALDGQINALATDGVNLYAAGFFRKAGADSCPGVGRWDGSSWHRVGVGTTSFVTSITWWNGQLVAGVTDGTSSISAFDGTYWHGLGDSTVATLSFNSLDACGARLVARAEYRPPSGAMADVRVYDGVGWTNVVDSWGPDMTGANLYTISAASVNGLLYVCGDNRMSANASSAIRTNKVAAWDGSAWSALGPGLGAGSQPVHVGQWGADVIVSGSLSVAGGDKVGRWDGANWSALATTASGLGSFVWATSPFRDSLCAAIDGPVVRRSGSTWSTVGTNGGTNGPSYALLEWNDRLVTTGAFTAADGQPAAHIAAWDGLQWASLGAGLNGNGLALCAYAGDLVVGGNFTTAGGQPALGVARWDGGAWHSMGTRARFICDFAEISGTLYAVGVFELEDLTRLNTVARWTGTDWHLLGSGAPYSLTSFPTEVFSALSFRWVEGYQGDLYGGGNMSFAFGQVTSCVTRLPAANNVAVGDRPATPTLALAASPNPARGPLLMSFSLPQSGHVRLVVHDIAGREVARLVDGEVSAGSHQVHWSAAAPPGLYFARLWSPGGESRVARVVRLE